MCSPSIWYSVIVKWFIDTFMTVSSMFFIYLSMTVTFIVSVAHLLSVIVGSSIRVNWFCYPFLMSMSLNAKSVLIYEAVSTIFVLVYVLIVI